MAVGELAVRAAWSALGAIALYAFLPANDPVPYPEVIVPARVIVEREPDTVRTFVDRVRTVIVTPAQVAVAPMGAVGEVAAFCRPTLLATTDTVEVPAPRLLLRSVTHSPGWFWRKDRVTLTGPTSHGDLKALTYSTRPGWTARTSGDSVLVRYPRTGLFRESVEFGVPLLLGFLLGR